jgi:CheY-like chemotaxis protein
VSTAVKVLLVDDNELRLRKLQALAPSVTFVWARSAGAALGILDRDRGRAYHAIMLDHDLDLAPIVPGDLGRDGRDVMAAIIRNVSTMTPIMVHSTNREYGATMATRLTEAGFYVEYAPISRLTREAFRDFLEYAQETWDNPGKRGL